MPEPLEGITSAVFNISMFDGSRVASQVVCTDRSAPCNETFLLTGQLLVRLFTRG